MTRQPDDDRRRGAPGAAGANDAPTISGEFVRLFLGSADCTGDEAAAVLARAGIGLSEAELSGARLSEPAFARFLGVLTRRRRDEFWGLASRPVPLGTFSTMCRVVVRCATLGEALAVGGRFYRLAIEEFAIRLRTRGERTIVWLEPRRELDLAHRSTLHGATMFLLYQVMCWFVDQRLALAAVHFDFPARAQTREAIRAYDSADIRFDQPRAALHLDSRLMSLPILGDGQRLARFLSGAPLAMLARYHDESRIGDRVRDVLRRNLGATIGLEDVASRLHLTPVTLRRRLSEEEGRSFSELRDGVRRRAALAMVAQGDMSFATVAARLGFAEYSTFHRAFRRWTGQAPGEYRAQHHRAADNRSQGR